LPATLVFIFHAVNLREATLSEDEVEKFLANYFLGQFAGDAGDKNFFIQT